MYFESQRSTYTHRKDEILRNVSAFFSRIRYLIPSLFGGTSALEREEFGAIIVGNQTKRENLTSISYWKNGDFVSAARKQAFAKTERGFLLLYNSGGHRPGFTSFYTLRPRPTGERRRTPHSCREELQVGEGGEQRRVDGHQVDEAAV